MRCSRTAILAGAAALLLAGTAQAATAKVNLMNVPLPDGSVAKIEYVGDVAPNVRIVPVQARTLVTYDPFAELDRIAAIMEARHRAMLLQMAALERAAAQALTAAPAEMKVVGNLPAGVRYTIVSSTTDANGCTRTVTYRSDGHSDAPQVTRASAGSCDAVDSGPGVIPVGTIASAAPQPGNRV